MEKNKDNSEKISFIKEFIIILMRISIVFLILNGAGIITEKIIKNNKKQEQLELKKLEKESKQLDSELLKLEKESKQLDSELKKLEKEL